MTIHGRNEAVNRISMTSSETTITPAQCKAARALLDLSRDDLADLADVGVATISDFERGRRQPYDRTLRDIQAALEQAGVVFLASEEDIGPGLRLRMPG
jgi:transcriptional regulator with XRE-family HTH domain